MTGFSFASLLMSMVMPALADEPIAEVQAASAPAPQPQSPITGRWESQIKGKELTLTLTLVNTSADAVDVVISRGSSPGPYVQASVDGTTLDRKMEKTEMKEQYSRMGPMPTWAAVAPGKEIVAGVYRFILPNNVDGKLIHVDAEVNQHDGSSSFSTDIGGAKPAV